MQNRYWSSMTEKKYNLFYIQLHFNKVVMVNRAIKIIMAIASCSSIAAWTIWQQYAYVWGVIIAVSQVIGAINEFLPYQKRIEELSNLESEWSVVFLSMEKKWYSVANGKLTDNEINDLLFEFENDWNIISDKYFKEDALPQVEKYQKIANEQMVEYIKQRYGE